MTLAQIVNDPNMAEVLIDNLFCHRGANIAIKPFATYLHDRDIDDGGRNENAGSSSKSSSNALDSRSDSPTHEPEKENFSSAVGHDRTRTRRTNSDGNEDSNLTEKDIHLSFWNVIQTARRMGDIVVGYKRKQDDTWTLNPSGKEVNFSLHPRDELVVVTNFSEPMKPAGYVMPTRGPQ